MEKFEYKFIDYHDLNSKLEEILNNYGKNGWEVVGYSSDAIFLTGVIRTHHFVLKREKK